MKKDIEFPKVSGIHVAIAKIEPEEWKVYLINRSKGRIDHLLITGSGYGEQAGKKQKTSTLRHGIPYLESGECALIEPIQEEVFHLYNEYWLSYYIGSQIYDKKFIFVPDSIVEKNLTFIPELNTQGVFHV